MSRSNREFKASNKPVRPTRRSSNEVKALLLDAAADEFSRQGYRDATVQGIARRADLSVSAVYRHFESKSDLFRQAACQPFLKFLDEFSRTWNQQREVPWDELKLMTEFASELYDNMRAHRKLLIEVTAARDHVDPGVIEELRKASSRMFMELRAIGEQEASLRKFFSAEGIELSVRLISGTITAMAVFDDWLAPSFPHPVSREILMDAIARLSLWGLSQTP
ncbi:helix-turn-helix domain containing protein [Mycobacterium sp. CVI_P3]|uniref:Helix-turn-helix domain containing protein n=1 Tax=Mycobacterium pinniadriaticum TaxID=2994102 RepID=A0ABT3SF38_9MYCO|nr:TetR/AcrR family transcriptional regulator [Mycobacterium pinniadriaticum]MCX2931799.1 helix-turn-helix domain containing protein [Mycobacterium pinniadriaticum]MCX2938126.1 helix-turn-helix domain containing protein [Mycobacterium pinniadriaticum]